MKKYNIFNREWVCAMEGGALINPHKSHWFYCEDAIEQLSDNYVDLTILYKKGVEITDWQNNVYKPTYGAGVLRSVESFSYGTFTADILLPKGKNLWPAFWLTGSELWPPEIDILEGYSDRRSNYLNYFKWDLESNVHYQNNDNPHMNIGGKGFPFFKLMKSPTKNFTNFKVEWTPTYIKFYVDNKIVRSVTDKKILDLINKSPHMYVVLSMEVKKDYWVSDLRSLTQPMRIKNFNYTPYINKKTLLHPIYI